MRRRRRLNRPTHRRSEARQTTGTQMHGDFLPLAGGHLRRHCEQQRCVRESGVRANLVVPVAVLAQVLGVTPYCAWRSGRARLACLLNHLRHGTWASALRRTGPTCPQCCRWQRTGFLPTPPGSSIVNWLAAWALISGTSESAPRRKVCGSRSARILRLAWIEVLVATLACRAAHGGWVRLQAGERDGLLAVDTDAIMAASHP